jgi:hypothetical protein
MTENERHDGVDEMDDADVADNAVLDHLRKAFGSMPDSATTASQRLVAERLTGEPQTR